MSYEEYNYQQVLILFGLLGTCKGIVTFENQYALEVLKESIKTVQSQLDQLEHDYNMGQTSPDDKVIK